MAIARAAELPAPGENQPKHGFSTLRAHGGGISKTSGKNFLEQHLYEKRHTPELNQPDGGFSSFGSTSGGAFNTSKSKTHIEWIEYHAAKLPGPMDTQPKHGAFATSIAATSSSSATGSKGVFSTAMPPTDVELAMRRAAELPAPGESQPKGGYSSLKSSGGTISEAKPKVSGREATRNGREEVACRDY